MAKSSARTKSKAASKSKRTSKGTKLSIEESNDKIDHFTALNDDCVYNILERLSLTQLLRVSNTCKRFRGLAWNVFRRQFQDLASQAVVVGKYDGVTRLAETPSFMKYFRKRLPVLAIRVSENLVDDEFWQFVRTKCHKNVKEIEIRLLEGKWNERFTDEIKKVLKRIESIEFVFYQDSVVEIDYLNEFLKHTPALKKFAMVGFGLEKFKYTLLELPQNLEAIDIYTCRSEMKELDKFFKKNPNISKFICRILDNVVLVQRILKLIYQTNVNELFLISSGTKEIDFATIKTELKMLDERENFKRFHLEMKETKMKNACELWRLKSFTYKE